MFELDKTLSIPEAQLWYDDSYYAFAKAEHLLQTLIKETPWQQNKITLFGKTHDEPRLTQLYGDSGLRYGYSGIEFKPLPWTETLLAIKADVEKIAETEFNVCLINRYRSGTDSNGWHADNENVLGKNPIIASVSLGAERDFHLRHNTNKNWRYKILLQHGSVLIMAGETQHTYKHQIAKTKKQIDERINLTFRKVIKII